ncbi:MAG: aminoacyl-histidine dipeptidase, partial [Bacillota bacterium]
MKTLDTIEPKAVFKHFRALSAIPHCSNDEKALSDALMAFASENGLKAKQDDAYNVVIEKPASEGYEKAPKVILQGHIDMVCTKEEGKTFDFSKDGLELYLEDGYLTADGTTLGADNGIAVAMIMAVLEDKGLKHPPLRALFTVGEEIGMIGVSKLDDTMVEGDILINLDAEDEGVFFAACAGGVRNNVSLPVVRSKGGENTGYTLRISGLKGGHSGLEIDKGRGNAIHLLGRLLDRLKKTVDYDLYSVQGGEKMNAIAKFASAQVSVQADTLKTLEETVKAMEEIFKEELKSTDPDVRITIEKTPLEKAPLSETTSRDLIGLLRLIPTGVNTMSFDIPGLVESSNNIGVLTTNEATIDIESAIRSSKGSLKEEIADRIEHIAHAYDATSVLNASYPEWPYQKHSPIRELMKTTYESLSGKEARVSAIHGGLETGFLLEKLGPMDVVALGPDIHDVHTPNERLDIASTKRTYALLLDVLSRIDASF